MKTRRLQRKIRKQKTLIFIAIALLVAIVAAVLIINGVAPDEQAPPSGEPTVYEITEVDLFSLKEPWDSRYVSVKGVRLNDPFDEVLKKLGFPDTQSMHPPDVINIEYSKRLGLEETGLILHFEKNILKRITFREPFNEFLHGKTKIGHTKAEIYGMFGAPDEVNHIPISQNSILLFRQNLYVAKGLEIFTRKNVQFAFALII